jgi:hypothetical protein
MHRGKKSKGKIESAAQVGGAESADMENAADGNPRIFWKDSRKRPML